MFLFKSSDEMLDSVVKNQVHAFAGQPHEWRVGELILVSKLREDRATGEKQIEFLMTLDSIRELREGESDQYWPGTEGRWRYLVQCRGTIRVRPFNLQEAIGLAAAEYFAVKAFKRIAPAHEQKIIRLLNSRNPGLDL